MKIKILLIVFAIFSTFQLKAQKDSLALRTERIAEVNDQEGKFKEYNPLAPAKAAFYSAIFPGLGQIYNGLGISILSTPRGVLSDLEAREANVGGEVLCRVF